MAQKIIIEVCVDSVESALAAVCGGADRLELCGNLGIGGGMTPSTGLLKAVQRAVPNIPIMVMIRPRCGDFVYTPAELEVMVEDIRHFRKLGVTGVVFGVLTCAGRVDTERTKQLVEEALPMQVCFHRAFDMTANYGEGLIDISAIPGITRILTSGHAKSVLDSMKHIKGDLLEICRTANSGRFLDGSFRFLSRPITIVAGSGINPATETFLARSTTCWPDRNPSFWRSLDRR